MNRERRSSKAVVLIAALAVVAFVSVTAVGLPSGIIFALALGTGVAVAVFSDSGRNACLPRFLRRRS